MEIAGKETGELDKELENIKEKTAAVEKERADLEEKSKPVVDVLNKVKSLDESANNEKSKCEQLISDIGARKKDIGSMELELHYYKEAIEEIGQKYL